MIKKYNIDNIICKQYLLILVMYFFLILKNYSSSKHNRRPDNIWILSKISQYKVHEQMDKDLVCEHMCSSHTI